MSEELKPCPFCGGKAHLANYNMRNGWQVVAECGNCASATWGAKTPQDAVKRWNRRYGRERVKPCPFCGGKAILVLHEREYEDEDPLYSIACQNTNCMSNTVISSNKKSISEIWDSDGVDPFTKHEEAEQ